MCSQPLHGVDVPAAEGEPGVARVGVSDYGGVDARWNGAVFALCRFGAEQGLSLVAPCQVWVISCGPGINFPALHLSWNTEWGLGFPFVSRVAEHIPPSDRLIRS